MSNTLTAHALAALQSATLDGDLLTLNGQMDRKVYEEVNKALTRIGGKWSRGRKGHVFDRPATEALAEIVGTGQMPQDADKLASFWPTPGPVADVLLDRVEVWLNGAADDNRIRVLEPSAGEGHLARAIRERLGPHAFITAVEPDERRASILRDTGVADLVHPGTLEDYLLDFTGAADLVVMNPPFTLPGQPAAWAEHIMRLWITPGLLGDGAAIAAIAPASVLSPSPRNQHVRYVQELVRQHGDVEPLPEDAFKAVGTGVRTAFLWLERARGGAA